MNGLARADRPRADRFDWRSFVRRNGRSLGLIILIFVTIAIVTTQSARYLSIQNLQVVGLQLAFEGLGALGLAFIVMQGNADISVGSIFTMAATSAALFASLGAPWPLALLGGILIGGLAGLVNGVLVWRIQISPIIVTLGTLLAYQGIVSIYTQGYGVASVPRSFQTLGGGVLLGIPTPVVVMLVAFGLAGIVLNRTTIGRHTLAIGGNKESAEAAGINVRRLVIGTYVFNGLIVGLAGVLAASRIGTADPNFGYNYLFDVLTIVLLGGVAFTGGEGTIVGVLLGLVFYGVLISGMVAAGVDPYWVDTVKGIALIAAVILDQLSVEQRARFQRVVAMRANSG